MVLESPMVNPRLILYDMWVQIIAQDLKTQQSVNWRPHKETF